MPSGSSGEGELEIYMNSIDFAFGTHTGLVRELNEDSHLALPKIGLWVVADGMGGHEAGEVASGITILEIAHSIEQGMPLPKAIEIDQTYCLHKSVCKKLKHFISGLIYPDTLSPALLA